MQQVVGSDIRPSRLLVKVSRAALDEASAHFPPSGKAYPLALSRLFSGRRFFTFHCGNAATPSSPTAVNLILASDIDDPENQVILNDLDNKTLSILGTHTGDRFEITRIAAVHRRVGTASNRVVTAAFAFHLKGGPGVTCLSPALYRQIAALPNDRRQTAANRQRIDHWDKYLEINEEMARGDQLVVRYVQCRVQPESLQLVCVLNDSGCGGPNGAARPRGAIGERQVGAGVQLVLEESIEDGQPTYQGPSVGTIRSYDGQECTLTIDLDDEFLSLWRAGRIAVPPSGRLFISKVGDLVQLRRLRNGLKALARGQAENPRLESFVFDAAQARLPADPIHLADADLLQPSLNPEQRQAVEGVLASPDLYLIQGPPGTGKTTVIAEICYQAAIRGQRILLASQTNLAVDNALGKLVHHPAIRALRKGNETSVQAEGLPFIERRVVATWLERTAAASDSKLAVLAGDMARLDAAQSNLPDIFAAHRDQRRKHRFLESIAPAIDDLQRRIEALDQEYRLLGAAFDQFMDDPAGPAFTALSTHADRFDTQTLILIGRVNAAAVRHAQERRRLDTDTARFEALCTSLERQTGATRHRLVRVEQAARLYRLDRFLRTPRPGSGRRPDADEACPESVALMQEPGLEFTLADHIQQTERLCRELAKQRRSAPGFLRILFGRTGTWAADARERLALAGWISANRERIVCEAQAAVETIVDNPAMSEAVRRLADTFHSLRESLLMKLNANLSEIDNLLEQDIQARTSLEDDRRRITAFLAGLPAPLPLDPDALPELMPPAPDSLPDRHPGPPDDSATAPDQNADWPAGIYRQAFAVARERLAARQSLVEDWVSRIRQPDADDLASLQQLYIDQANVIGITCSQSGSHAFSRQYPAFDVVIVDEVSKATPPELVLPLLKAKKIVLVGDHRQLPPMVGMETYEGIARQLGIPEAETAHMQAGLFEELYTKAPQPLHRMLTTQYRMHPQIMETINQFYAADSGANAAKRGAGLRCGIVDPDVRRRHGCQGRAIGSDDHALWVDLPQTAANRERRVDTSYANPAEAAAIRQILLTLGANLKANDPGAVQTVGVISFYSSQVRLLETELQGAAFAARVPNLNLRIGSVDRFQGIECPIVICSFVRNNDRGDIGFARDPRRINVALSRAQSLMIIVGCSDLFCAAGAAGSSGRTGAVASAEPGAVAVAGSFEGPDREPDAAAIYGTIADCIRSHGGFRNALDFC